MDIFSWDNILYCFIFYWIFSIFFFFNPNLLHKKKKLSKINQYAFKENKIIHISHRGGSRENLENTIQSFAHANKLESNVIEMDICLTKDKQIVVVHDSLLKRMTGVNKHVEEFNYEDLPPIMDVVTIDFTVHKEFNTMNSTHKYFPLFEDVLKQFPDIQINVEVKTPTEEFLSILNALILKYNRSDSIVWGCRPPAFNKRIFEVNPKIRRWFNEQAVIKSYFFYAIGLIPFLSLGEDSFQVPLYTREFHEWKQKEAKTLVQKISVFGMFTIIKIWTLISKPLFYHLKLRGIVSYLWVLNTEQEFDQAVKLGATGIMTDSPTKLKEYLIKKNLFIENSKIH